MTCFPHLSGRACWLYAVGLVVSGMLLNASATAQTSPTTLELVKIGVPGLGSLGGEAAMVTHVFKPTGSGPFPVLLFSHGRAGDAATRSRLSSPISMGHVRYWLAKGYAVVAPVRPGYGDTGGADTESSGVGYGVNGACTRQPAPARTAAAAMRSTSLALQWVRTQPWAMADKILLEGQSVGGLTTVALCATNPPGVVGCINFSGGAGGDPERAPGNMCAPEKTTALMADYGRTTQPPTLWFYAENDLFWGAEAPRQWHAAFAQSGSPIEFIQSPDVSPDGHRLLALGGKLWSEPLDAWLKKYGF